MKTFPSLAFVILVLLWVRAEIFAQAISFHAGVYSLSAVDQPASSKVYENPFIAGIAVRTLWQTLEPTEGQFDWSFIDSEIQTAATAGKKVSIYFAASSRGTPDWVYAAGAQPYRFIDQNPNHPTYGDTLLMPLPWDSVYIAKWTNFIRALGSRYANDTTLSYIRGASESVTNGWGLPETDAFGRAWSTYGYTPDTLLAVMKTVVDTFMTAFPRKAQWVEVGIIKFETQLSGRSQTYVAEQIAAYGFQTYPDRFGVWREDISGCIPNPPTRGHWKILWDHKGRDGAQMLWSVQDGPTRMNQCGITPNDKATVLKAAVQTGLDYGMPYLEIYQADVLDAALASVIQFAAENLGKTVTSVDERSQRPIDFVLHQNYPNPFNPSTVISFQLSVNSHVTLKVFDVNGREVATLVDGEMEAGKHAVTFAPRDLAGGLYSYKITAGKFSQTRQAILMK